ncbi:MAG: type II toxin-antitoxin system RelE/ParE family toxin [Dehalococcoidia bacterium]|nr:type II toxin-antitoxin system RelE/ParE family toxin [Dehalococcoidia bacterium]
MVFTHGATEDLRALRPFEQRLILDHVESLLTFEPLVPARNKKPLSSNAVSAWEVRLGRFRVFYDVDEGPRLVTVRAVGRKERDKLYIGGEEFRL